MARRASRVEKALKNAVGVASHFAQHAQVLGAGEDAHGTWWGRSPSRVMNQYRAVMVHYSRVKQTPPGDVSPSLRVENDELDAHVLLAMPSRSEASVGTLSHGSNEPLPRGTDPLLAQETDPPGTRVTITKPGHQVTRGRKVRGLSEACSTSRTRPTSLIKVLCPSLRIEHDELDATAFSRPSAVALSAMGLVSPFPCAPSRLAPAPLPRDTSSPTAPAPARASGSTARTHGHRSAPRCSPSLTWDAPPSRSPPHRAARTTSVATSPSRFQNSPPFSSIGSGRRDRHHLSRHDRSRRRPLHHWAAGR